MHHCITPGWAMCLLYFKKLTTLNKQSMCIFSVSFALSALKRCKSPHWVSVLTCAGVIINSNVAGVTHAHKCAGRVHAHCVFSAVVFPLCTLINICGIQNAVCITTYTQHIWEGTSSTDGRSIIHGAAAVH